MKKSSDNKKFSKLMIVAHPDDELIFGGAELIKNKDYKVICITNQDNPKRLKEFTGLMKDLKVSYEILDHPDSLNTKNVNTDYINHIDNIIKNNLSKLTKIVTHNNKGEYGHNFHKAVSKMVTELCKKYNIIDKLYYFGKGKTRIEKDLIIKKLELMKKYYPSQYKVLARLNLQNDIEKESFKKAI